MILSKKSKLFKLIFLILFAIGLSFAFLVYKEKKRNSLIYFKEYIQKKYEKVNIQINNNKNNSLIEIHSKENSKKLLFFILKLNVNIENLIFIQENDYLFVSFYICGDMPKIVFNFQEPENIKKEIIKKTNNDFLFKNIKPKTLKKKRKIKISYL